MKPFDVLVSRKVQCDWLVSFEGHRYSVPFQWVGGHVETLRTLSHVVIRGEREKVARHARATAQRLLIDPRRYEGTSTDRIVCSSSSSSAPPAPSDSTVSDTVGQDVGHVEIVVLKHDDLVSQ